MNMECIYRLINLKNRSGSDTIVGILNSMLESKVSDKIVLTPVKIATDMIEILPDEVWNKDTKFLDPLL